MARRNFVQKRRVVENKEGETIDVPDGSGLLVTGCNDCVVNALGRSSSVTVERCQGTTVNVGRVVASLEIIHCTDVQVSVARCRTITVDMSNNARVSCKCEPSSSSDEEHGEGEEEEAKVCPGEAAEEAAAIRLYTSSSEGVSIEFQGLLSDAGDSADTAVTYDVPKDFRYEKGDGPRSVTRIVAVDGSGSGGGGSCETLRCDQFGTPLDVRPPQGEGGGSA
eukprot:g9907.t1